jgi:hypothetical protein
MTRFLSKPRPSPAGRRGNPQEPAGIRLAGKRPEQGIPAVVAGAPDRIRTSVQARLCLVCLVCLASRAALGHFRIGGLSEQDLSEARG